MVNQHYELILCKQCALPTLCFGIPHDKIVLDIISFNILRLWRHCPIAIGLIPMIRVCGIEFWNLTNPVDRASIGTSSTVEYYYMRGIGGVIVCLKVLWGLVGVIVCFKVLWVIIGRVIVCFKMLRGIGGVTVCFKMLWGTLVCNTKFNGALSFGSDTYPQGPSSNIRKEESHIWLRDV